MELFEAENDRDHHGNAFKEFFGDNPLSSVSPRVPQFVEWLMEKYFGNRQTVSKKVIGGSAMFRWLRKKKQLMIFVVYQLLVQREPQGGAGRLGDAARDLEHLLGGEGAVVVAGV